MADVQCRGYAGCIPVYCSHDKIVPVEDVKPNPKNPNQHPENQIEMLAKIITTQGWRAPVTVSTRSGLVVRGHGRLMAAKFAGLDFVPVDFQHYESNDAELADLLADNKIAELSDIDNKLLAEVFADIDIDCLDVDLTGYTEKEYKSITRALEKAAEAQEMNDPEAEVTLPKVLTTKPGDVWRIGRHRLMCGDSTNKETVLKLLDGEKADMVFTDPPYGVNVKGGKGKGNLIMGDLTQTAIPFSFEIAVDVATKDKAHFYFCGGESNLQLYQKLFDRYLHILPKHLIWVKNGFVMKQNGYHNQFEIIFHGYKIGAGGLWYGGRTEHEASDVWRVDRDPTSTYVHPTQKPVELPARAIRNSCQEGAIVFEPFGGSGSTMIACEQLDRICYAMELDPKFCDVIVRRYIQVTGKRDVVLVREGKEIPVDKTGILND